MDPVLLGVTIGTLLTSSLVLWQRGNSKSSQAPARKTTTDTDTNLSSRTEEN